MDYVKSNINMWKDIQSFVRILHLFSLNQMWLKKGGTSIGGHIYAQVYDDLQDKWIWVDPMRRNVGNPPGAERVVFGEGLDSWDLGIKDYSSLKSEFKTFRNQWLLKSRV